LTPEYLRTLIQKLEAKTAPDFEVRDLCFDKQIAFIEDKADYIMAVTSRRAGKTTACAFHLLSTALQNSNSLSVYITLARTNAKGIVWPVLHELNREYKLGGVANESDLIFRFPNGSRIWASGAATSVEIDRFRGHAFKLVYIDEAQSFGNHLSSLIDDVLRFAVMDYRGQIRMIGTPGPVPVGYYHDVWADKIRGWNKHHWTVFDNPFIQQKRGQSPKEYLDEELKNRGLTEDNPTIQREVFGRFVVDSSKLVLNYEGARNDYTNLPRGLNYVFGIDVGFEDADAIAVIGFTHTEPTTYLIEEHLVNKQGLTELVGAIERLRERYKPIKLMIDEGGLGKKLAEEMRRRHRIPVQPAEKQRKFETIEFLNDALRTKRFMAKKDSRFANDAMLLEWDFEKMRPDKKVVSDRFHSDIIDAVLYAFKESPAYSWAPEPIKPKIGTPEWGKQEEERMYQASLERLTKEKEESDLGLDWL
jgi:hypothetical protein